jgi:hypothetical protein
MVKVVINKCYGGFRLSQEANDLYESRAGKALCLWTTDRHDPILVGVVEELGRQANACHSDLRIVEVVSADKYHIDECDGWEDVVEF